MSDYVKKRDYVNMARRTWGTLFQDSDCPKLRKSFFYIKRKLERIVREYKRIPKALNRKKKI